MTKQYVVVGGTSGMGAEVARTLAGEGARLQILSRGNAEVGELPGATWHRCDAATEEPDFPDVEGPLDGLVYLPGSLNLKPFHLTKPEVFRADLEVNLFGAVRTLQRYLKNLKESPAASVVMVSTVAVQTGMPYHASIAAAKGAVEGLTRALAAELAPRIWVNAIAPSITDTPMAEGLLNQPAKQERAAERHPLKRIGTPADMAGAIGFLLGEQSSWMTGQILHVDGGMSTLRML